MNLPTVETKVAASSGTALVVSVLFALAGHYHWFAPPPPAVTASIVTLLTAVVGWLAPHTSRGLSPAEVAMIEKSRAAAAASVTTAPSGS